MRFKLLLIAVIFLTGVSSASVYGTFPEELEKQSDSLNTELGVGIVNAGNQELKINFRFADSRLYNVSGPEEVVLKPVEVTSSPEGEGWKYLGEGKYARIQEFSFDVEISEYRDSNRVDIPLQIEASPTGDTGGSSSSPVSQVTSHNFTMFLSPQLRPLERQTQMEKEVYWEDSGGDEVPEEWRDDEESSPETGSKTYKANETDKITGEGEKNGPGTVTMMLVIGIVACIGYIFRVV